METEIKSVSFYSHIYKFVEQYDFADKKTLTESLVNALSKVLFIYIKYIFQKLLPNKSSRSDKFEMINTEVSVSDYDICFEIDLKLSNTIYKIDWYIDKHWWLYLKNKLSLDNEYLFSYQKINNVKLLGLLDILNTIDQEFIKKFENNQPKLAQRYFIGPFKATVAENEEFIFPEFKIALFNQILLWFYRPQEDILDFFSKWKDYIKYTKQYNWFCRYINMLNSVFTKYDPLLSDAIPLVLFLEKIDYLDPSDDSVFSKLLDNKKDSYWISWFVYSLENFCSGFWENQYFSPCKLSDFCNNTLEDKL